MLESVNYYLKSFIEKRTDELGQNVLMGHKDYQLLSESLKTKFNEVLEQASDEQRELLLKYEEEGQIQTALAIELMYKQGLMDGIYIYQRVFGN
ncbi:hypothetical protein [Paenibacillus chitinolyticus]|uniref:hypothetical protein n=1 Tax=Paenibacillus chitinolyticus TaxID=79263 RepID=UPI003D076295